MTPERCYSGCQTLECPFWHLGKLRNHHVVKKALSFSSKGDDYFYSLSPIDLADTVIFRISIIHISSDIKMKINTSGQVFQVLVIVDGMDERIAAR